MPQVQSTKRVREYESPKDEIARFESSPSLPKLSRSRPGIGDTKSNANSELHRRRRLIFES